MLEFAFKTFSSIFIIMGPFSVIPIFLAITANNNKEEKKKIISKAIKCALAICLTFAIFGTYFFQIFGISINSFRIAGGLLMLIMAVNMLHANKSKVRVTSEEEQEGVEKDDVSIFPLAVPLITGPGAISTVVLMASDAHTWPHWAILIAAIILSSLLMYIILNMSEKFYKVLGQTGINIMTRVMGLILAAISVEYILKGIRDYFSL